jgi:hypothetical protein
MNLSQECNNSTKTALHVSTDVDEVILPVADREEPFTGGMKAEVDANNRQLVVELLIATTDTSSVSLFYLLYHLASEDAQV